MMASVRVYGCPDPDCPLAIVAIHGPGSGPHRDHLCPGCGVTRRYRLLGWLEMLTVEELRRLRERERSETVQELLEDLDRLEVEIAESFRRLRKRHHDGNEGDTQT